MRKDKHGNVDGSRGSMGGGTKVAPIRLIDGEYYLSAPGVLLLMLETDLADLKPSGRARMRAFHERAKGLIEAESIRAAPRPPLDVLVDRFGDALNRAMLNDSIETWLDGFLVEQARGLS